MNTTRGKGMECPDGQGWSQKWSFLHSFARESLEGDLGGGFGASLVCFFLQYALRLSWPWARLGRLLALVH